MAGAIDAIKGFFGRLSGKSASAPTVEPYAPSPLTEYSPPSQNPYVETPALPRIAPTLAPMIAPRRELNGMEVPITAFFSTAAWDGNRVVVAPPPRAVRMENPEGVVSLSDRPRSLSNNAAITSFFSVVDWTGNSVTDQVFAAVSVQAPATGSQPMALAAARGPQEFDAKSVFGDFDFN